MRVTYRDLPENSTIHSYTHFLHVQAQLAALATTLALIPGIAMYAHLNASIRLLEDALSKYIEDNTEVVEKRLDENDIIEIDPDIHEYRCRDLYCEVVLKIKS